MKYDDIISVGELDVPSEYFELTDKEKKIVLIHILEAMLKVIDAKVPVYINKIDVLRNIINSSIETNVEAENFEMCSVLRDLLNEIDG